MAGEWYRTNAPGMMYIVDTLKGAPDGYDVRNLTKAMVEAGTWSLKELKSQEQKKEAGKKKKKRFTTKRPECSSVQGEEVTSGSEPRSSEREGELTGRQHPVSQDTASSTQKPSEENNQEGSNAAGGSHDRDAQDEECEQTGGGGEEKNGGGG